QAGPAFHGRDRRGPGRAQRGRHDHRPGQEAGHERGRRGRGNLRPGRMAQAQRLSLRPGLPVRTAGTARGLHRPPAGRGAGRLRVRARVRRIQRGWIESRIALRAHPVRMAQIALPWALGLFVLVPLLWHEMDRAVQEPERRAGQEAVSYAGRSMLRWIERLRDDTRFLAALTPRLVQSDARPESPLLDTYTSFLRAGTAYHKVRWIDARGRERLRVDQEDGRITEVPGRQLQDKSGRPFF